MSLRQKRNRKRHFLTAAKMRPRAEPKNGKLYQSPLVLPSEKKEDRVSAAFESMLDDEAERNEQ